MPPLLSSELLNLEVCLRRPAAVSHFLEALCSYVVPPSRYQQKLEKEIWAIHPVA